MKQLLVIQRRMTHYRVPFFNALREKCHEQGIRLRVAHGIGTDSEARKDDSATLQWAEQLKTRYFFGDRLCWQPFRHLLPGADMVVVTQENKLINNLYTQYADRSIRFGYWGHGANLQGAQNSFRERYKRVSVARADWWFAYTEMSVPLVKQSGFPPQRITVLNNSIDLSKMAHDSSSVSEAERMQLRTQVGLSGHRIAAYVGSLYAEKRVEFMLEAARKIRGNIPDFEFIIIGTGPQKDIVENFCRDNPWVKYVGAQKGRNKVALLSLAKLMINPGLVGLGILDSFICGLPLITTDCGLHSPEIAYLNNGVNGVMTANVMDEYVATVTRLLNDDELIKNLRNGCITSAKYYSIDNMATNFVDGALRCLESPIVRFSL